MHDTTRSGALRPRLLLGLVLGAAGGGAMMLFAAPRLQAVPQQALGAGGGSPITACVTDHVITTDPHVVVKLSQNTPIKLDGEVDFWLFEATQVGAATVVQAADVKDVFDEDGDVDITFPASTDIGSVALKLKDNPDAGNYIVFYTVTIPTGQLHGSFNLIIK